MLRGGPSQPGVNDIQYSEERGERPALSRLCNAPPADTEHCFPLSPLCLLGTKINKPLSLAPSLSTSLMKCNLLSPNIVHHAPALLCKVSLSRLYLCFPFCVPQRLCDFKKTKLCFLLALALIAHISCQLGSNQSSICV